MIFAAGNRAEPVTTTLSWNMLINKLSQWLRLAVNLWCILLFARCCWSWSEPNIIKLSHSSSKQHQHDVPTIFGRRALLDRCVQASTIPLLGSNFMSSAGAAVEGPTKLIPAFGETVDAIQHPFHYSSNWVGTKLPLITLERACATAMEGMLISDLLTRKPAWPFARWPDPILRRPANRIAEHGSDMTLDLAARDSWQSREDLLKCGAQILANTARLHGAVGLAAQQCGIDARLLYIENPNNSRNNKNSLAMVMVNPLIVQRSSETEMMCWQEECLVLPPGFEATVLRDAWIDVEFEEISVDSVSKQNSGQRQIRRFMGEAARCIQHELDHDRGILTVDHIGFDEMESDAMRSIEQVGHDWRHQLAFDRYLNEPQQQQYS